MRYVVALLIGVGVLFGVNQFTGLFSLPRPWGSLLMGATVGLTMVVVLLIWETISPSQHGQVPGTAGTPAKEQPSGEGQSSARTGAPAGAEAPETAGTPAGAEANDDARLEARAGGQERFAAEAGARGGDAGVRDDAQEAEDVTNRPSDDSESENLAVITGDHMADEPGVGEADGSSLENPPPGEARTLGEPTEDDGPAVIGDPGRDVEAPDEIEIPDTADSDSAPDDGADGSETAEDSGASDVSERDDPTDFDAYGGRTDPDPKPHSDSGVAQESDGRD